MTRSNAALQRLLPSKIGGSLPQTGRSGWSVYETCDGYCHGCGSAVPLTSGRVSPAAVVSEIQRDDRQRSSNVGPVRHARRSDREGCASRRSSRIPRCRREPSSGMQQYYQGVPVWGAEVVRDSDGGVPVSIFGDVSAQLDLDTQPALTGRCRARQVFLSQCRVGHVVAPGQPRGAPAAERGAAPGVHERRGG